MSSGVQATSECIAAFQDLKLGRKLKFIIYGLSDDKKEIVVKKTSEDKDFETFLGELPENDCVWAVYDFEFDSGEGLRNKITFISWAPDEAKIKSKMVFASSKDAIKRRLDGLQVEIQATSLDEVSYEALLEKSSRR